MFAVIKSLLIATSMIPNEKEHDTIVIILVDVLWVFRRTNVITI